MPRPRNTKSTKKKKKTHHFQYNCTLFSSRQNTKPHTQTKKKQKDFLKKKKKKLQQKRNQRTENQKENFNQRATRPNNRCCGEAHTSKKGS
jgi:hypothetical protein